MRIDEVTDTDIAKMVALFGDLLKICQQELDFDKLPKIVWVSDGSYGTKFHSFGSFQPDAGIVTVSITGRHIIDMMRTLAHELVHYKQMLDGRLGPNAGETGSPIENEANAMAGVIMRKFDHMHPEAFSIKPIMIENVKHNLNKMLGEGQSEPRKPFKTYDPYAPQPVINMQPPDGSIARVGQRLAGKAGPAQNSDPSHWPSNTNGIITPGGQIGTAWKPDPKADNTPYTPYKPDWATNKPDPAWSPEKLRANQSYQDGQVPVDKWKDNEWGGKTSPSGVHANPATLDTSKWVNNQPPDATKGAGQDWPTGTTQQDKPSFLKKEIDPQAVANSAPQPEAPKPAAPEAASDVEKLNELLAEFKMPPNQRLSNNVIDQRIPGEWYHPSNIVKSIDNDKSIVPMADRPTLAPSKKPPEASDVTSMDLISHSFQNPSKAAVTPNSFARAIKPNATDKEQPPQPTAPAEPKPTLPAAPATAAPKAAPRPDEFKTAPEPQQVAAEPKTDAETLNELLAEHSVEIGHIYGNKNLPKTKDKIHSADKGKIHRGLRISEVVGGTPEVYVDMDGVLADFFKDWNKMVGVGHWKEIQDPEAALDLIRKHPTFWIDLDVLSNAPRLLGAIKKFAGSYYICTSPLGKDPNCEPQKREWVQKHLSGFAPKEVYVTSNKPQFARQANGTPNILIDDFGKNIAAWTAAGGIGIHYENKNSNRAIMELKAAMNPDPVQTTLDQAKPAKPALEKSKDL